MKDLGLLERLTLRAHRGALTSLFFFTDNFFTGATDLAEKEELLIFKSIQQKCNSVSYFLIR